MESANSKVDRYMKIDQLFRMYVITRRIYHDITRAFSREGYDYLLEHFIIIMLLSQKKILKQNDITLDIIRNKATVTRAVDKLVERDFVKRIEDPDDRRINILEITDAGQALYVQLQGIYENIKNKADKGIGQEEIDGFLKTFEIIAANIEA